MLKKRWKSLRSYAKNTPKPSNNYRDCSALPAPGAPRRSQALPGAPRRALALPDAPKRSQTLLSAPRRSQALLSAPRRSQALPGAPRRSQALLSAPSRSQALRPDPPVRVHACQVYTHHTLMSRPPDPTRPLGSARPEPTLVVLTTRGEIIFYVGVEMRVGLIATAGDSVAGRLSAQAS